MWTPRRAPERVALRCALDPPGSRLHAKLLLLAGPAAAGRQLTTQVTLAAYDQEPGSVVSPRVTTRDQAGRPISGVRCVLTWRLPQGPASKVRFSGAAGVVRDPRRIAGLPGDTEVVVVVRSTWRGQVSRCRTWFRVQRPVPAEPTILFVGDSITLGMFAFDEYGCYRSLVAQRFPCMPLTEASAGAQSKDVDLESVRTTAADIVVVELGTNDAVRAPGRRAGRPRGLPQEPARGRRGGARGQRGRAPRLPHHLAGTTQAPRVRRPHRRPRGGLRTTSSSRWRRSRTTPSAPGRPACPRSSGSPTAGTPTTTGTSSSRGAWGRRSVSCCAPPPASRHRRGAPDRSAGSGAARPPLVA